MLDVSLGIAFLAGLLSFLSPCVLPLVPPYLAYIAGVSIDQLDEDGRVNRATRIKVFTAALGFVAGFTTVFVLLGATASILGQVVSQYLVLLSMIAGLIIIVFGLHFLGFFKLSILYKEARFNNQKSTSGPAGAYIMGLAFAFGWTPCVGPILAAILSIAGSGESVNRGMMLLIVYSLGIGIPFLIAALFAPQFIKWMKSFKKHLGLVEKIVGVLLVITGFLFLNNNGWIPFLPSMTDFAFYLLEAFPALQEVEGLLES